MRERPGSEESSEFKANSPERKPSPKRFMAAIETLIKTATKKVNVEGVERIKEIPKNRKIVVATSHISDLDVQAAVYALGRELDLVITNQSVQYSFKLDPKSNIGMKIAGTENFMPIDYESVENAEGFKNPKAFNPENFEKMSEVMDQGKTMVLAAHNPSHSGRLEKGGYGAAYLAEISNAMIVPVGISVRTTTGAEAGMSHKPLEALLARPEVDVKVGEAFEIEKIEGLEDLGKILAKRKNGERLTRPEIDRFSELRKQLEDRSQKIMDKISALVPEEKRMLEDE